MKGLDIYKTQDGFTVARLHYTADPDKDPETVAGKAWLIEALKGIPGGMASPQWRKEMEIDFLAFSGQLLCYKVMQTHRDKIIVPYQVKSIDNLYGSVDWGRNNPAAFHVYAVDEFKNIHSIYEVYVRDTSIPDFCSMIKNCPYYQRLIWISADPSIWNMNQEQKDILRSLEMIFRDNGIVLKKSKDRNDQLPINELLDRWDKLDNISPRFTISPECPKQIWEFERLRYQTRTAASIENANNSEQLVDKDNHSWDNFKYFIHTWISPASNENVEAPINPKSLNGYLERQRQQKGNKFV
jgi:hypothetical protein